MPHTVTGNIKEREKTRETLDKQYPVSSKTQELYRSNAKSTNAVVYSKNLITLTQDLIRKT